MIRLNPKLLDKARKQLGFTSDEKLANHIGISRGGLHGLRHGHSAPSAKTLWELSKATGIPMEEWLVEEEPAA